ncbi:hypothetical protein F441_16778 [Phytophthora nicotianae CJ01A1]|uniref:Uncharacterized protein n=1 Tax=Phytophthora nicotianae CJ01A1 TaxID=1317063 RepID=W2WBE7_PHYNI|nr:hypothetical protein F441_16778 [Phytophthora nicotianae CJ01A1]
MHSSSRVHWHLQFSQSEHDEPGAKTGVSFALTGLGFHSFTETAPTSPSLSRSLRQRTLESPGSAGQHVVRGVVPEQHAALIVWATHNLLTLSRYQVADRAHCNNGLKCWMRLRNLYRQGFYHFCHKLVNTSGINCPKRYLPFVAGKYRPYCQR